ncbi:MAG: Pleiotropic regulatory protein [Parcubacteria group bacterium GW2011_GWE2_38_18]|nr:MAG: Pleiotropic regulatory protein [Parcubacteria group bacterium GW2011_GWE2_38_18]
MMIPFIDLTREWQFFEKAFLAGLKQFGRDGHYVLGKYTEIFEKNFANQIGYKYAIGVSTGLTALEIALLAHGINKDDEVITVSNSAVATSLAISNIGAKPVFCDVKDDFLIDEKLIERLINKKTKAILPVHLFGKICNMRTINRIAKKQGLIVLEDACQAHGASFSGDSAKNTKAFSFYPTKNLGALGEAGMITTNDKKVRDFAIAFRNYGQKERYNHLIKGNNYRIDSLQCVFLDTKLKELDNFIDRRRFIAQRYINELSEIHDFSIDPFDLTSSYHLFVIRVLDGKRDELKNYLNKEGITALVHYPSTIHQQPCYQAEYAKIALKNTEKLQEEILSLPCYPFFTDIEQTLVINKIKKFFS